MVECRSEVFADTANGAVSGDRSLVAGQRVALSSSDTIRANRVLLLPDKEGKEAVPNQGVAMRSVMCRR